MSRKRIQIGPFMKGLNNVQKENNIGLDSLNSAINVNIDDSGKLSRRKGYTKIYSGTDIHSLIGFNNELYFVEGGSLKRFRENSTALTIQDGIGQNELDHIILNTECLIINKNIIGKIDTLGEFKNVGVSPPPGQPKLVASNGGGLQEGTYQVAVTFLNSAGEESGTPTASSITIDDGDGILLLGIPQNDDASSINIYATKANGTVLFKQANIPMGTSSGTLNHLLNGEELKTQFGSVPPTGQFIEYYNGRIFIANDNILYFSEPFRYGLFKTQFNFIEFPETIKFLKALNTGLYVGSNFVYFLRGDSPEDFSYKMVFQCSPIYNTAILTETTLFNFENIFGKCVFFWSDQGAMVAIEEGSVIPVSNRRYLPDKYDKGVSYLKQDEGVSQIVTTVTKKGPVASIQASDSVSAEVVRHGITIG